MSKSFAPFPFPRVVVITFGLPLQVRAAVGPFFQDDSPAGVCNALGTVCQVPEYIRDRQCGGCHRDLDLFLGEVVPFFAGIKTVICRPKLCGCHWKFRTQSWKRMVLHV